jgi:superoxide dismutase
MYVYTNLCVFVGGGCPTPPYFLHLLYRKHHQTYVTKLNAATEGKDRAPLEDLIETATGGVFNNAAQIWNHTLCVCWMCVMGVVGVDRYG